MSGVSSPQQSDLGHIGELSAKEAWDRLSGDQGALLVDVRSRAEWNFVGVPDLRPLTRSVILVEWQSYPPGPTPNPNFLSELMGALQNAGHKAGSALFFICRSGSRSRRAASIATDAGLRPCFNISDGFEGDIDPDRHRGTAEGWKASGLPWVQT
jgi:rhodanese-related sulfurtransferase